MNISIYDRIRPFLSRFVIAPLAVALVRVIGAKTGIMIDSGQVGVAVDLAIYGIVHKVADKALNPADTASAHLALNGIADASNLKP